MHANKFCELPSFSIVPIGSKITDEISKSLSTVANKIIVISHDRNHDPRDLVSATSRQYLEEMDIIRYAHIADVLPESSINTIKNWLNDHTITEAMKGIGANHSLYYGGRVYETLNGPEPSLEMMESRNELMKIIGLGTPVQQLPRGTIRKQQIVHSRLWAPILTLMPQVFNYSAIAGQTKIIPLNIHKNHLNYFPLFQCIQKEKISSLRLVQTIPALVDLSNSSWAEVKNFREMNSERLAKTFSIIIDYLEGRCDFLEMRQYVISTYANISENNPMANCVMIGGATLDLAKMLHNNFLSLTYYVTPSTAQSVNS